MLKGIDVILHTHTQSGTDEFGSPIYTDSSEIVGNVLVGEPSTDDVITEQQLYGRKLAYTLAIPKGDAHDWLNKKIEFFNETFQSYGDVTQGIDALIPLQWNKKVKVERYE